MAHYRINPSTHQEWLDSRKKGIGGSDVAAVLGIDKYKTPFQLWLEKTGQCDGAVENQAMRMGHILEPVVAQLYEEETGKKIIPSSAGDWMFVNSNKEFLRSSPDRLYWNSENHKSRSAKAILECKTTLKRIDKDDIPTNWFCQLQYNMGIAELEHGALAWLSQGRDFDYMDVSFKKDFFLWVCDEVEKFWVDNVLGMKAPNAITINDVMAKYPESTSGKQISVPQDVYEASIQYRELSDKIEEMEEARDALKSKITSAFGDAEIIDYNGVPIATFKSQKGRTSFDKDRFSKEHPDLYAEYVKVGNPFRTLRFK